jgi:hypothetical protein
VFLDQLGLHQYEALFEEAGFEIMGDLHSMTEAGENGERETRRSEKAGEKGRERTMGERGEEIVRKNPSGERNKMALFFCLQPVR